jgi:hypothetical protein
MLEASPIPRCRNRTRLKRDVLLVFLLLLFEACAPEISCESIPEEWNPPDNDHGQEGDLGKGFFFYVCVDEKYDPACLDMEVTDHYPEFPKVIAVQSLFDLEYIKDSGDACAGIAGGSPNHIVDNGVALESLKAGYAVLVAYNWIDTAYDIVHILAEPVSSVCIIDNSIGAFEPIETIELEQGGSMELRGIPSDEQSRRLAGLLAYKWIIEDPEVAELKGDETRSVVTVKGMQQGHTTLTVEVGGIALQVDIEVGGEEGDAGVDGGPDLDAGPDAAVEPDGGFDEPR